MQAFPPAECAPKARPHPEGLLRECESCPALSPPPPVTSAVALLRHRTTAGQRTGQHQQKEGQNLYLYRCLNPSVRHGGMVTALLLQCCRKGQ